MPRAGRVTVRNRVRSLEEVTELGRQYAETKDPAVQLELCQCFHPYLMKYLTMICRGHLPVVGVGDASRRLNKDVEPFIKYFLPKGTEVNRSSLSKAIRHFHLAFKAMEPEEIYDILTGLLLAAINGFDPCYKDKLKQVAEVIDHELSKQRQFSAAIVNRHLEFDGVRHLRLLVRAGFLADFREEKKRAFCGYASLPTAR